MNCFEATIEENTIKSVSDLLRDGSLGFGAEVPKFEESFKAFSKKDYNIGINSASSAAFCLFSYLYSKHGSCDVYTPSVGFTSPAWAAIANGHNVYFLDVDENLLVNFDSYWDIRRFHLERQFNTTFNKSVFMPVLYGGVSDISGLIEKVRGTNWNDIIVVDSAHCLQPKIDYDYAFFSFHPIKPLTMANGGLLATNDSKADSYIRSYRNFGRENVGLSYDITREGFNFYMNNINATIGLSQLASVQKNINIRKSNYEYLKSELKDIGYFTRHDEDSSYYLSTLILKAGLSSTELRRKLINKGAAASFHYPLLHKTKYYKDKCFNVGLKNSESLEDRIINLPIHQNLTKQDLDKVIKIINE